MNAPAAALGLFDPARNTLSLDAGWVAEGRTWLAGERFPGEAADDPLHAGHAPTADGRYALVAHDVAASALVLARDPAGSVSLFWQRGRDGCIRFATDLDALLRSLPDTPAISRQGLDEFLRFLDIAPPNTIYDRVHALEAGQALRLTAAGEQPLPAPPPAAVSGGYPEACDRVEAALKAAIARRLVDARSPAAFLSGGIDSALLCALAVGAGFPVTAWSAGFDDPVLDESATAARIAAHLGCRHEVVRPDTAALAAAFERVHARAEQPFCDPAGMPTRLLYEACAAQSDRALDGTGAEALPGIMPARWRRIAHDHAARLPRALRRALAGGLRPLPGVGGYARLFEFDVAQDLYIRWQGFRSGDIARLTGRPPDLSGTRFYREHAALAGASHLKRLSVLQGEAQPDDRIRQAARATGLRVDHPFGAPQVSGLLRALPEDWAWQPGREKRLLRDLLARQVPEALWDAPKRGFNIDLPTLLRRQDAALVRSALDATGALDAAGLDRAEVVRWRDRFLAGDDLATHRVWALTALSAWLGRHHSAASARAADTAPRLQ